MMKASDFIKCPNHDSLCGIKTNVFETSKNYKQSFHFCSDKISNCGFIKPVQIDEVKCKKHTSEVIFLRQPMMENSVLKCYYQCKKHDLEHTSKWCGRDVIELGLECGEKENIEATTNLARVKPVLNAQPLKVVADSRSNSVKSNVDFKHMSRTHLKSLLEEKTKLFASTNRFLPDKGKKLQDQMDSLKKAILEWKPEEATPELQEKQKSAATHCNSIHSEFKSTFSIPFDAFYKDGNNPLYVGPNNAARKQKIITVTLDAVESLHESLKSKPKSGDEEDVGNGLLVSLLEHQRYGLKWALWRENQHPSGGIIADEMGLGKTVLTIALMVRKKQIEGSSKPASLHSEKSQVAPTDCTLIICPTSLLHHWESEILKKCQPNSMSVLVYHGPRRESSASRLAKNDAIITTYDIIRNEIPPITDDETPVSVSKQSPLLRLLFSRIILDEGHVIKNPKTNVSKAVCRLQARHRWVLTGTPIHNKLKDVYSLLKFLRFSPFDEEAVWRHWVDNGTAAGESRLKSIIEAILLRRTKSDTGANGKPLINLPLKENLDIALILSNDERVVYDELLLYSQAVLVNFLKKDSGPAQLKSTAEDKLKGNLSSALQRNLPTNASMAQILVLFLRLQQCCCHLSLLKLNFCQENDDNGVDDLVAQMENMTLTKSDLVTATTDKLSFKALENNAFYQATDKLFASTKIAALMEKLKTCLPTGKCVVVSQWTSFLDVVGYHLQKSKIRFCEISGRIPSKQRGEIVEEFNNKMTGPKVMLLSLKAGGVGLNLTGGRYLFLMDIHWNPALEAQACDRIHRFGQKENVKIFRFVCEKSIENKIVDLHERKLKLAKNVLEGHSSKLSRLTLEDLRTLFGV